MTYKVGDLVYFDGDRYKGVGKIVVVDDECVAEPYLVHSTKIIGGHDGYGYLEKQDSDNNWWFIGEELKPFTKKVGQKYKALVNYRTFIKGEIITLVDVNAHESIGLYENDGGYRWLMHDLDHPKCELEFYADVEEHKENKMFTKDDLKVGYLVEVRDGRFAHLVDTIDNGMCLNYENGWDTLRVYNNDLTSRGSDRLDIIEVYGFTIKGYHAHKFEVRDRKLLWKREEVKEMTIEDIQKVLGHKIKVVE